MQKQIIAISGGGFSEEEGSFIDEYILKIPRKDNKLRMAFLATASNDAQGYIDKFYEVFKHEIPSHIPISNLSSPTIQETVNQLDVVYVGGGNTQYMLNMWRETGFDQVLHNAYEHGVILCGVSAGAMCWFEHCYSETNGGEFEYFAGLGILKGALCPHYNDPYRKEQFDKWVPHQKDMPIYALRDNESVHFIDGHFMARIVT